MAKKRNVDLEIKMISAVTEALDYKKKSKVSDEDIMKHVSKFINQEKDKQTKLAMIASVSNALKILERKELSDREVIKKVMSDLPKIIGGIEN